MNYQRCRYKNNIEKIPVRDIGGQSYVLLDDVQDRFSDVRYFTYNKETLPFELDDNHIRLKPLRIKANIEIIIDCHKPMNNVKVTSELHDDMRQQIYQIHHNSTRILENTEILMKKADRILRQTFELAEFTVPRLFIVLPEYTSRYNPANWFHLNYRLYFLCECENGKKPHLAFHEGYKIKQPGEFLRKFGPYLRDMLTVLKCAIVVGSFIVPQLTPIALGISTLCIPRDPYSWNNLSIQLDQLDQILVEAEKSFNISTDRQVQRVEGAALREIEYFLMKTDEHRKFGNLFRSVTNDGDVQWVCIQHYEQCYSENTIKDLHEQFQNLGGVITRDIAIIRKKTSKNFKDLLSILCKGLRVCSIILTDLKIYKEDFQNLLSFLSQQSTIDNLQLENITVLQFRFHMRNRCIISELNKTLQNNDKLQIQYNFTKPLSEFVSETIHTITKVNPRLIFQLKLRANISSFELTGTKKTGFTLSINNSNETDLANYHREIQNIFTLIPNITKIVLHNGIISDRIWSCFFDFLTTNVSLEELTLDCQLTLEQTKELSLSLSFDRTLKNLQMSNVWKQNDKLSGFEEIFQALLMNTGLFELNLSYHTDQIQLDFIAKYLLLNQSLKVLRLPKCQIQENTDIEICESFFQNASLHTLSLELISTNCQASLERLVRAMDKNETLDTIELKGSDSSAIFHRENHIHDYENSVLSLSAARTKSKKFFGLFRWHRSKHPQYPHEESATQLVPLERNHNKSVSDELFYQLCHHPPLFKEIQEMTQNFKLDELDVTVEARIQMTDLTSSIKSNLTVTRLKISNREVTGEDIQMLVNALRDNTTITHLNLNEIKMSIDKFRQIFDVLRTDRTLRVLEVKHCISHSDRDVFTKEVKQLEITNPALKIVYDSDLN